MFLNIKCNLRKYAKWITVYRVVDTVNQHSVHSEPYVCNTYGIVQIKRIINDETVLFVHNENIISKHEKTYQNSNNSLKT